MGQVYILYDEYKISETLEYSCGRTQRIKINFNNVKYDFQKMSYLIEGEMYDLKDYTPIDSSYGFIFLRDIETIIADTWLGYTETGL